MMLASYDDYVAALYAFRRFFVRCDFAVDELAGFCIILDVFVDFDVLQSLSFVMSMIEEFVCRSLKYSRVFYDFVEGFS